jgi:hypothetical protein
LLRLALIVVLRRVELDAAVNEEIGHSVKTCGCVSCGFGGGGLAPYLPLSLVMEVRNRVALVAEVACS